MYKEIYVTTSKMIPVLYNILMSLISFQILFNWYHDFKFYKVFLKPYTKSNSKWIKDLKGIKKFWSN
jgi:hypothetical protein